MNNNGEDMDYKIDKHIGVYGLIIKDDRILLIKKKTGPYDGKLDLPGGGLEFRERPEDTLKRELKEEVGIDIKDYALFDADSVSPDWIWNDTPIKTHHIGIFYKILSYENEIKKEVEITDINDDSLGADFYKISDLTQDNLSLIAILELEKLGYKIND